MNVRRFLVVAGLAGAVALAAVAGTAMAQTPTPTPNQQSKTDYQNFFLDRLAQALGITRDNLNAGLTSARNDTVDQAVKDGRLTQQQADQIKSQQGVGPFGFGFGRGGHGDRGGMRGMPFLGGRDALNAVAQVLGTTPQDLANQLRSGKTLADIAGDKAPAVKDAIVNAEKARLDQAVQAGRMTQAQEDQILNQIRNSDLSQIGGHWGMKGGRNGGNGNSTPTPGASTRFPGGFGLSGA